MSALAIGVLFAWGLLVFLNYWPAFGFSPDWVIKAVSAQGLPLAVEDMLGALAGHLGHVVLSLLVLLAARGLGERARRLLGCKPDALLVSLPLGLVLLAGTGLGLGLAGLVYRGVLAGVVVAGLLAGGWRFRIGSLFAGTTWPLWLLVGAVAVPALFGALAPEVTYDALAYHTGAPHLYLGMHRIVRLEHMFFTDLPMGLQMPYMFVAGLGAVEGAGAKIMHWWLGLACVGVSVRLGALMASRNVRVMESSSTGAWTAAFLIATPFVATQMMRANVDLGVMFFTATGVFWLLASGGTRRAFVAGIFLGAAASVKLTGGYGIVAAALVFAFGREETGNKWKTLGFFLAGAALPLAPWFGKSLFLCGNPVYPFFWSVFGGVGWGIENVAIYMRDMTGPTSFNIQYPGFVDRLAGPWRMIMHDRGGEAALSPFAVWLAPVALLLAVRARAIRASGGSRSRSGMSEPKGGSGMSEPKGGSGISEISGFLAVFWLLWFVTARDSRFFLPAWPVASALAAWTLCELRGTAARTAKLVCVAALAFVPFFSASIVYRTLNPGPVVWGAIPRDLYRDRMIPPAGRYAPLAHATNRLVPADEKVLIVGDVKGAIILPCPVYPSMFDTPHLVAWLRDSASARRLRVKLRQRGIGAIFHNVGGAVYLRRQFGHFDYSDRQRRVLGQFWGTYLTPLREIREDGSVVMGLYRLRESSGVERDLPLPGGGRSRSGMSEPKGGSRSDISEIRGGSGMSEPKGGSRSDISEIRGGSGISEIRGGSRNGISETSGGSRSDISETSGGER